MSYPTRTRLLTAAIGAAALLSAVGCAADESNRSSDSTSSQHAAESHSVTSSAAAAAQRDDFDQADVTFLAGMYPHHAQAVAMAELVPERSQNPRIRELATSIEQAQQPEMDQIAALLQSFGQPAPTTAMSAMDGHAGMMSNQQMTDLAAASGSTFDTMFLTMMIAHHQGAVEMANAELAEGRNPDTKQLAEQIITAQQSEIDLMNTLLAGS
ncbi:DUF305 domain-containing protein [Skermania piniformis]|uniref:DUF305 domain-containing protein n=1 Tax=Skermania pinensis TaxID=39122 RepID=A0ABX8SBB3_9ACTN|nr:DUF305 domain-containing protein [Skermania piniformis]QXQ15144.1 DUF305 domain-containing protein [Skermania piniformis]